MRKKGNRKFIILSYFPFTHVDIPSCLYIDSSSAVLSKHSGIFLKFQNVFFLNQTLPNENTPLKLYVVLVTSHTTKMGYQRFPFYF